MTLKDLRIGQSARVAGFVKGNDKSYRKKLLSMGLTPDTLFSVTRVAPMGDPIEIAVRGFSLSLRGDEAASLLVEAA
ncbi:MAG: ferrous iron transport protein A [Zoogloeaceae bacterium]|jgi:ferrous iron transport protein A|nr:ferrous iron transport protein A [Zoogloeaceae bacterium]